MNTGISANVISWTALYQTTPTRVRCSSRRLPNLSSLSYRGTRQLKASISTTSFCTQIIHTRVIADPVYTAENPFTKDAGGAGLSTEARGLLVALQRFATSLVYRQAIQQTERQHESPRISDSPQGVSSRCGCPATPDVADSDAMELDASEDVQPHDAVDNHVQESSSPELIGASECSYVTPNVYGGFQVVGVVPYWNSEKQLLIKDIMDSARDMVFNRMPIRLLMFDEDGKGIKLVERSEVLHCLSLDIFATLDARQFISRPELRGHSIKKFLSDHKFGQYAILSHTWLPSGEVTYSEWKNRTALDTQSPGYVKLAKFCQVAATEYGLRLAWMDTVCINKESSAELDESIRSMFKWYGGAKICIVYLAGTTSLDDMERDNWFKRGWTLQELLAPHCVRFFTANWTAVLDDPANKWVCNKSWGSPS